jgi:hypothetical protein
MIPPSRGRPQARRDAAITALLLAPMIEALVEQASISKPTSCAGCGTPAVSAECRAARRTVAEAAIGWPQQATIRVADVLVRHPTCGVPAAEIAAAKAVPDQTMGESEVLDPVAEVEALRAVRGGPAGARA